MLKFGLLKLMALKKDWARGLIPVLVFMVYFGHFGLFFSRDWFVTLIWDKLRAITKILSIRSQ